MRLSLTLFSILLAGCGSSPKTNFYMLSAAGDAGRRSISFPVQLAAVHIPPSLDRKQMVRMTGQNSVKINETERWSAPLDLMIRNTLAEDLAGRLSKNRMILPDAPAPSGTGALVVVITEFGPDASGNVKLNGSWSLIAGGSGATVLERDFKITGPPGATADSMASAMSLALGQLATQIASSLSRVDSGDLAPSPPESPTPAAQNQSARFQRLGDGIGKVAFHRLN